MKLLSFSIVLIVVLSCNSASDVVPVTATLKAKHLILDEKLSPQIIKCSEDIPNFLNMKEDDCSFILGNSEYDIEEKMLVVKSKKNISIRSRKFIYQFQ